MNYIAFIGVIILVVSVSFCTPVKRSYSGNHVIMFDQAAPSTFKNSDVGNIIYMVDGSEIRGEIVNQNRTAITVKTKYTTMTIEKKNIREIKYK